MSERPQFLNEEISDVDGVTPSAANPLSKHRKMAEHPFRFFRGSAGLFYKDLACGTLLNRLPRSLYTEIPLACIQGDCHLSNLGFITEEGSHGDNVIFAPNDFDDACTGHAIWDLLRFSTSVILAVDSVQRQQQAFSQAYRATTQDATDGIEHFLLHYVDQCQRLLDTPGLRNQVVEYFHKSHSLYRLWKKARKRSAGGKKFAHKSALAKATEISEGRIHIAHNPCKFTPLDEATRDNLVKHFRPYMDDAILDVAERLGAGTGSVDLARYYMLVGPETADYEKDLELCHIVEVKQQRLAAPLRHFPNLSPVNQLDPAHLTVTCQRRMQRRPDLVLEDVIWNDKHWLVRSRHHARVGIAPEDILTATSAPQAPRRQLLQFCAVAGQAVALAHSRSDRRSCRFEQAVVTHVPPAISTIASVAQNYAGQCIADWHQLNQWLNGM